MEQFVSQFGGISAPPQPKQFVSQFGGVTEQPSQEEPATPSPFGSNRGVAPPNSKSPEDFNKSMIAGAQQAPFWLGDAANALTQGITRTAGAAYTGLGGDLSPEQAEKLTNPTLPFEGSQDIYKDAGMPLYQPKTPLGIFGQLLGNAGGMGGIGEAAPLADAAGSKIADAAKSIPEGFSNRVKGAISSLSPEDLATQSDKNWQEASDLFKSSTANGAVVSDNAAQNIFSKVRDAVGSLRSRHSDTSGTLDDFEKTVQKGNVTPADLHDFRKDLNDVISENTKSKIDGGGINEDGQKAMAAKNALDEALLGISEKDLSSGTPQAITDLQNGINSTARSYRYDRIADLIKKSEGDATAIKRNFTSFVNKDSNLNGFNNEEIAALKDAAQRGTLESIERGMGTFGLDFGKVKNVALPVIAGTSSAVVPGIGLPLSVAGTALRQTGKWAARGKAQTALDTIMSRDTAPIVRPPSEPPPTAPQLALPAPLAGKMLAGAQGEITPIESGQHDAMYEAQQRIANDRTQNIPPRAASELGQAIKTKGNLPFTEENAKRLFDNSGSASIPAAITTTAIGAAAKGSLGQQNQSELQKLQFPQQPQQKSYSSFPDISSFAKAESGGNPNAKNPNSSASGLYQFTNKTWNNMVMRYGKQTGIGLGDKNNPQAQATMAALLAKDNIASLQASLGRTPTKGELYMAHVLGANGAQKLIKANPDQEALMLYPRPVLDANRNIFFNGKIPRTAAQVYQLLSQKVA